MSTSARTLRPAERRRMVPIYLFGLVGGVMLVALVVAGFALSQSGGNWLVWFAPMVAVVLLGAYAIVFFAYPMGGPLVVEADDRYITFRLGPIKFKQFGRASVAFLERSVYTPVTGLPSRRKPQALVGFMGQDGRVLGVLWAANYEPPAIEAFASALRLTVREKDGGPSGREDDSKS